LKFARWVFLIAGIYGVLALVPMYFQEATVAQTRPPAITHAEYYYGFIGVALAWQVLFLQLSRDPRRHRPLMVPSMLEKAGFGCAMLVLYAQHRLSNLMLAAGLVDLLFVVLFALAYRLTRDAMLPEP
jgi:hypothetical protein